MRREYKWIIVLSVILLLLICVLIGLIKATEKSASADVPMDSEVLTKPAFLDGRDPAEYTWEEYMQLTVEEQAEFPDYFESLDAFKAWYETASEVKEEIPVENAYLNGKDPASFTWEEYTRLTPEQQAQFPDTFESLDAYNAWYQIVYGQAGEDAEQIPLENDYLNGRDPAGFTWEEYNQLTPEQQAQFPDHFESMDAYKNWYDSVYPEEEIHQDEMLMDKEFLNGKDPADITWEEYQEMTPEQQAMFPDHFESYDAFLDWKDTTEP